MLLYLIKLNRDNFSVVTISKTFKTLKFKEEKSFKDIQELKKFLKNKSHLYFSIFSTNTIKTTMDIPKIIKGDSTIKLMIEAKFSKEMNLDKKEINYSFYQVDETKDSIRYNIDGVYESDYENFYSVAKPKSVEVASLDIYSLYSLNRYFHKDKSFISLYINFESMVIVAGDDKVLLFSRVLTLKETNDLKILKDEITKNILYIKQKTRLNYDMVTLNITTIDSGELLIDIAKYTKIDTINLTPNLLFKNIDFEIFNRYLIEFGTLVMEENLNFIPIDFKSKKQFNQILNFYITILVLISIWLGFDIFNKNSEYFELKDRYSILKNRLINSFSKIKVGDSNSESFILSFLNLISTNPNYLLLSQVEAISTKLTNLNIDFDTFEWKLKSAILTLNFEKKFDDLFALNEFLGELNRRVVGSDNRIKVDINSDYKELSVKAKFTLTGQFK